MQFRCPYCQKVLNIPGRYAGQRGTCNKCGGKIALVGASKTGGIPTASRVAPEQGQSEAASHEPVTENQAAYLHDLGVSPDEARRLDRQKASTLIEQKQNERSESEPPTEKQINLLRRLGLSGKELAGIPSKAEASRRIEALQPPPTPRQLEYLERLGATPEQRAALKTRSEASDLIERALRGGQLRP